MNEIELIKKAQEWAIQHGADLAVNVVVFLLIMFFGAFVVKATTRVISRLLSKSERINETLERFIVNVAGKVLWVILLMIALPRLGIDIAPLIAGLGVTGFIVGFAFQESLGNLAAGLMIILNAPFKKGDVIEAAGSVGKVEEINMMATTMVSPDNKKIMIPNSQIWGSTIVNYTANDTRRVDLTAGIGYGDDIEKARELLLKICRNHELVLSDPEPVVELVEMADSSVNFTVRPWAKTDDYWTVYFDLNRTIKQDFDANGIEIPFPQMDVHHHGLPEKGTAG